MCLCACACVLVVWEFFSVMYKPFCSVSFISRFEISNDQFRNNKKVNNVTRMSNNVFLAENEKD